MPRRPLADHLASHPAAFDGLLSPEENPNPARLSAGPTEGCEACSRMSSRSPAAPCARRTLPSPVATMEGRINADEAGLRRTAIADAALEAPVAARAGGLCHPFRSGAVMARWRW